MARYVYTHTIGGRVIDYKESRPDEDAMDEVDGLTAVGFSGNGYLAFWERCKRDFLKMRRLYTALKEIDMMGMWLDATIPEGDEEAVITDLYTGEEKRI